MAPQIRRYLAKISSPLLDRIDIHIEVLRLSSGELMGRRAGESSTTVRRRGVKAREKQVDRLKGVGTRANVQMGAKAIQEFCEMYSSTKELLKAAIARFN